MNYIIIAIFSVVFLFLLMQVWIVIKTKSNKVKDLSGISGEIGKAISNHKSLVLYFFSPSCSACKVQTPMVEELKKSFPNIFSLDISKDINLARQFGVMATPTTLVVKNKVIKEVFLDAQRKEKLLSYLQ